jgi:hypothetical protein
VSRFQSTSSTKDLRVGTCIGGSSKRPRPFGMLRGPQNRCDFSDGRILQVAGEGNIRFSDMLPAGTCTRRAVSCLSTAYYKAWKASSYSEEPRTTFAG